MSDSSLMIAKCRLSDIGKSCSSRPVGAPTYGLVRYQPLSMIDLIHDAVKMPSRAYVAGTCQSSCPRLQTHHAMARLIDATAAYGSERKQAAMVRCAIVMGRTLSRAPNTGSY